MNIAREVAERLLDVGAVRLQPLQPFTWASGLRSPIYCDNRVLLSHPDSRDFIIDCMARLSEELQPFDGVAGVATAGIAHGALLAHKLKMPFIYVRSSAKAHGRQNRIEGDVEQAGRYLVVEDLISTGGSSLEAVEALRETGVTVAGVQAIFTYGFPRAAEAFNGAACPAAALSHYGELLQVARDRDYINEEQLKTLDAWRRDPQAWSDQYNR